MSNNTALVALSKAEHALVETDNIVEVIELRTKARAIEIIAIAQGYEEIAQRAKIFQLRAERKAGGWLGDNLQYGGNSRSRSVTLSDLEISRKQSSRWQLMASIPEEKFHCWLDDRVAKGQEVTAGGLRNYARNIQGRPIVGRATSGIYILNPVGCSLIGYGCQCVGDFQNGHIINESKARGNAKVKKYLKNEMNISLQCVAHNVGRWADTYEARKIQLLQKIFKHGWSEVSNYYSNVPWKVPKPEFELERMLE